MFTVEDDRRTSVSDPALRTSSIDQVTLSNSYSNIKSATHPAPPFPQHVGPTTGAPSVHVAQSQESILKPSLSGPRIRWDDIPRREDEELKQIPQRKNPDDAAQLRAIDIWLAARPRIAAIRIQILTYRVDVKRERDGYSRVESLIETVLEQFMEVLGTAGTTGSYMSSWTHLEQLRDKLLSYREDLKKQRQKLSAVEDGLSNQEYKLTELEQEIYEELDREYLSGPSSQHHARATLHTPPTTTSAGNTSHSARQELYSRMGDLRVLLDRLNDFELDIRQELDDRDISRAHGEMNLIPDEEFFEKHRAERKQLQKEMERIQVEVNRLKQLCDSQGVQYEDVQFLEPLYGASNSSLSSASAMPPQVSAPDPATSQRSGSSSVIKTFLNSRDRVKKWLGDPLNPAEVGRPIAEEHEVENLGLRNSTDPMVSTNNGDLTSSSIREIRSALEDMPSLLASSGLDQQDRGRLRRSASETALQ